MAEAVLSRAERRRARARAQAKRVALRAGGLLALATSLSGLIGLMAMQPDGGGTKFTAGEASFRQAVALESPGTTPGTLGVQHAGGSVNQPPLSASVGLGSLQIGSRHSTTTTTSPTTTTTTTTSGVGGGSSGGSSGGGSGGTTNAPFTLGENGQQLDCGGDAHLAMDGQQYSCSFDDEFSQDSTIDPSKWLVQTTAHSGYHSGLECYENDPSNVNLDGGTLNLTAEQVPTPVYCPASPAPYTTPYTSGMVSTYQRFNQTYGVYEVRAKIADATVQGLQTSFWLWHSTKTYGSSSSIGGEIDFAELFSEYPNLAIPDIHYNNAKSDPNSTATNCVIGDPSQFHTYELEWTPHSMKIVYDGQTCLVDHWSPNFPQNAPAPFDQPFYLCLTQALGWDTNMFVPADTPMPATTSVAWVRAWSLDPTTGNSGNTGSGNTGTGNSGSSHTNSVSNTSTTSGNS